jgi:hypothetical protein
MTPHLSTEQISQLLAGEGTAQQQEHASKCTECASELDLMRNVLSDFRDSVRQWADNASPASKTDRVLLPAPPTHRAQFVRWAVVAAALILLITISLHKNTNKRHREMDTLEDTRLLEQVNVHLSRSVPAPMEPLMEIISDAAGEKVGGRQ